MNLQETLSTAITETVAAVMDPSVAMSFNALKNNTKIYSYDTSAQSGWTGDGGGGGGNIGHGEGGSSASFSDSSSNLGGSASFEASSDILIGSSNNYLSNFDHNGSHHHALMNESDMFYGEGRCQNYDYVSNKSYWNVTCDSPVEYIVPLYGYSMPFLLITTVLSNSLIVLILSKKKMSTPTNFVLMGKSND